LVFVDYSVDTTPTPLCLQLVDKHVVLVQTRVKMAKSESFLAIVITSVLLLFPFGPFILFR